MPLALTLGGLAAVSSIGAAAFILAPRHAPSASPLATTAQKPTRPLAASPDSAKRPNPAPTTGIVKIAKLDRPFTLVYAATFRNVRTKAMNDAEIAKREKEYAADVDADRLTQATMDQRIANLRASLQGPPRTARITLAYDGKTLLYDERETANGTEPPNVNLFTGKFTYHFNGSAKNYDSQGSRDPGTLQYNTSSLPYVGPSIPFFPLLIGASVSNLLAFDTRPVYVKGKVWPNRHGIAKHIAVGAANPPSTEVVLSEPFALAGTYVARTVVLTRRDYYEDSVDLGAPYLEITYKLVSARPSADKSLFWPESYLSDGDTFRVNASLRETKYFPYRKAAGPLDAQIAAAKPGHNGL